MLGADSASDWSARASDRFEPTRPWKVLIACQNSLAEGALPDRAAEIRILGREVEFLHAWTVEELLAQREVHADIAVALIDLDLEDDQRRSGLKAITALRDRPGNPHMRVVLLTEGNPEPGHYDWMDSALIDDVRNRSDLERGRLFTLLYSNIRQFHEVSVADQTRRGIERIVDASSTILRRKMPERLARGGLDLLCSVMGIDAVADEDHFDAAMVRMLSSGQVQILARIGKRARQDPARAPNEALREILALDPPSMGVKWTRRDDSLYVRMRGEADVDAALWVNCDSAMVNVPDQVINVFSRHLCNSLVAAELHQSLTRTQNGLILMLSEAIERRSMETSNHVRRVGEYSRLLGRLYGFGDDEAERLLIAAALHDAGKVAIPDAILNKPGKLTDEERAVMETHASIGARMFEGQDLPVLRAAMTIAIQHHERWDGTGYPAKLKGEEIHIYGRIAGLADVFDALGSHRCYKRAWPLEDVLAFISAERGRHFDPDLVDLFLDNLGLFLEIRDRFVDPPPP